MKGLELSGSFYEEYGKPMLENEFPELLPFLAAGLIGSGSECAGFDDDVSEDHDFEPGFCIFIPDENVLDRKKAFLLERAYAKLPREYKGYTRPLMQPAGGARRGVILISEFTKARTGSPDGRLSPEQWFRVPEHELFELTGGELYFDHYGELTRIREELAYYPEDIRRKKLAENLFLMAQSGQYNFLRIYDHGEPAAAQLAVFEFVNSCVSVIFLLNKKYRPYYKWCFRAMRSLGLLSEMERPLETLMTSGNSSENVMEKADMIEDISAAVIRELTAQKLSEASCGDLEKHSYSVNDTIADGRIRNW